MSSGTPGKIPIPLNLRGASATAELRRVAGTAAPALEEPVDGAAAILMSAAHVLARLHPTFFQE